MFPTISSKRDIHQLKEKWRETEREKNREIDEDTQTYMHVTLKTVSLASFNSATPFENCVWNGARHSVTCDCLHASSAA